MRVITYEVIDRPSQNAAVAEYETYDEAWDHARRLNWQWWKDYFFVLAFVLCLFQWGEPYAVQVREENYEDE